MAITKLQLRIIRPGSFFWCVKNQYLHPVGRKIKVKIIVPDKICHIPLVNWINLTVSKVHKNGVQDILAQSVLINIKDAVEAGAADVLLGLLQFHIAAIFG